MSKIYSENDHRYSLRISIHYFLLNLVLSVPILSHRIRNYF